MYIQKFHIEQFGPLENITVENLPNTMAIFLGDNEAGKSSSMEFIRTMLTGIPNKRDLIYQNMKKFKGGSLLLDDEEYGEMLIERNFSARSNRNLKVFNNTGKKIDNSIFLTAIDNISQDVYRLIFGFTLAELQNFSVFQDNNVFENILGASYGLGLVNPDIALQKIQENMEILYKPKGKHSVLQDLFSKWKDEHARFEISNKRVEKFDELQQKLADAKQSYEELKQEKEHIKEQEEELHRLLALWGQWKKWADLQKEFSQMKSIGGDFFNASDNAEILFTKILEQRRIKQQQADELLAKQREYEARLRKFNIKKALISQYNPIKELAPHYSEASKIITEIPIQEVQIEQSFHAVTKQNSKVIDKWCSFNPNIQVQEFNNPEHTLKHFSPILKDSLFLEELERYATKIREAKAHIQNAKTALEYAKRDTEKAELKYQAVLLEKNQQDPTDFSKDTLFRQEDIDFEHDLQIWQNRLQGTQENEREFLDRSAARCAEFLNQAKDMGFTTLKDSNITKQNAKEFLQIYMQLAQIVRDAHSKEAEINCLIHEHENLLKKAKQLENDYQEQRKNTPCLTEQDKKRMEKIHAIEKASQNIIKQLEQLCSSKNIKKTEALPQFVHIPSVACFIFGLAFLLLRLGSDGVNVQTFLGTLNIPYFLPAILLGAGVGLELFFHLSITKSTKSDIKQAENTVNSEKINTLVQDLQELQDIQEKLLQTFYPEKIQHSNSDNTNSPYTDTIIDNQDNLLHFNKTLNEKIQEPHRSNLERIIEKAKEKATLYSHYAKQFPILEITPNSIIFPEEIETVKEKARLIEENVRHFLDSLQLSIDNIKQIPSFFQNIQKLDTLVQEINELSIQVRNCHHVYEDFIRWIKTEIPHLFETFSGLSTELYLPALAEYHQNIKEEQFKRIQELHGAIFAQSLASLEESKDHYANVQKTLLERKKFLEQIYHDFAAFLQEHGFLFKDMQEKFVNLLCAEEQEQDSFSGIFLNIKQCVDALYHLHRLYAEQEERKNTLAHMHETLKNFIDPLRTILLRSDFSPKNPIRAEKDYLKAYQDICEEAEQECDLFKQKEAMVQEYEEIQKRCFQAEQEVNEVQKALNELYTTANVNDENSLKALFTKIKESERYIQQAIIIEESFREEKIPMYIAKSSTPQKREYKELPNQSKLPELFDFFDDKAKERFENELIELKDESAGLLRIEKHIQELTGKVEAESAYLYEESLSNEAGYHMKKTEEEIKNSYNKWLEFAFAKEVLERAKKQYEENSQPKIIQIASEFFSVITNGAWQGIKVNLEDRSVHIFDKNGSMLQAEMLSQGAREQLYLSLRLAHIKNRSVNKRPLPLLMDDILVNFDEKRICNTANLLNLMVKDPLGKHNNQQIFYYTCHERTAKILQECVEGTKLYHVQDKKIFAE